MYISYLRIQHDFQKETEIFQALDTFLTIDFSASDARLTSVNRVAQSLLALSIPTLPQLVLTFRAPKVSLLCLSMPLLKRPEITLNRPANSIALAGSSIWGY
jgi:hypothetical protein